MTVKKNTFRKIPVAGWLSGVFNLTFEYAFYLVALFINSLPARAAQAFVPKIAAIDDAIPFLPVFVYGYVFSYAFWVIAPVLTALPGKRNLYNYFVSNILSVLAGFAILVAFPTCLDRAAEGILGAASGKGLTAWLLRTIFENDGGQIGRNLLPSFHCMLSTTIWLSVAGKKEIPPAARIAVGISALTVYCSTLFVKQHYFADAVAGILLAAVCHFAARALDFGGKIEKRAADKKEKE